jgi:hypothetical protein
VDEQVTAQRKRIRRTAVVLFLIAGALFAGAIVRLWLL